MGVERLALQLEAGGATVSRLTRGHLAAAAAEATGQGTTPLDVHWEHGDVLDLLHNAVWGSQGTDHCNSSDKSRPQYYHRKFEMQKCRLYEDVLDLEERPPPPPPKGPEPRLNFLTARILRSLCRTLTSSRGLMPSHENECRLDCLAG